jgi:hypothetical protein
MQTNSINLTQIQIDAFGILIVCGWVNKLVKNCISYIDQNTLLLPHTNSYNYNVVMYM